MKPVILAILLVLIPFLISESFARTLPTLTRVRVQGNRFVTTDGKLMVFRGLNASDPDKLEKSDHWEKDYLAEMKRWGANLVRFPVHPSAWRERGAEAYLALLDQGVAWAGQLGLYVIIDWHSIGNLKTEMYQNPLDHTTRHETYAFWRTVAARYKDNPTVAFFELFNEPTVMSGKLGDCTWPEWKAMSEEMIAVIRSTGAETIPLVAGFRWAYDLTEVATQPVDAEGVAYVSHPYPMKREKPWEDKWTADWGFVSKKYPVVLTEIGFCGPDDKGAHVPVISDESYGDAITAYADTHGISYVVWVFDPQWAPMLFSDWNYTPTRQGRYFKKALSRYAGR
ncbi:MAG: glycoside hydrolase family 5 protein [Cytophagales bacterium]|nr:glycoside hydrolase family 5 protein [Cytophagales bacterium]